MLTTEQPVLGEFARHDFTLEHPDDHFLELRHQGELVCVFSQLGAVQESIQGECARHLVTKHGWNGCIWSEKQRS